METHRENNTANGSIHTQRTHNSLMVCLNAFALTVRGERVCAHCECAVAYTHFPSSESQHSQSTHKITIPPERGKNV